MSENKTIQKHVPADFLHDERLYAGFRKADLNDGNSLIEISFFRFPDFSCNWNRYSAPKDVQNRENGLPTDGCISFSVEASRFQNMATPCHDPLPEMYSHTEIRQLKENEPTTFEPPRDRKLDSRNWSKTKRREYRQHLVFNHIVELDPIA